MLPKPPLTLIIIGLCALVFAALNLLGGESVLRSLLISEFYQPVLPEVKDGQIWRLFTPILLHFSIFHIVFNLLWTWELGRIVESRQGSMALLIVILLAALVSNLAQYHIDGPGFGGMSGVVYALFGYVWIQGLYNPRFGVRLNPPIVYLMVGWFIVCWTGVLEWLFDLQVANTAHTGGLAVGIFLAFLLCVWQRLVKK